MRLAIGVTVGVLVVLAACEPSSPSTAIVVDAGADASFSTPRDAGDPGDAGDAGTASDASKPSDLCPSGKRRASPGIIAAIAELLGSWTVIPADGSNQRTLAFGSTPGSVASPGALDWGCIYADRDLNGGIDLYYDQIQLTPPCSREGYLLRFVDKNAVPNAFGFVEVYRAFVSGGGTDIASYWRREGVNLNFDGQHFTPGGSALCP